MDTTLTELDKPLPVRRTELVPWSLGDSGPHLVRNRRTGETFQLGREEQFLLEQLDGRQSAAQVCAAFAARFSQSLSRDELAEFLELAAKRGFLQSPGLASALAPPASNSLSSSGGEGRGEEADPSGRGRYAGRASTEPLAQSDWERGTDRMGEGNGLTLSPQARRGTKPGRSGGEVQMRPSLPRQTFRRLLTASEALLERFGGGLQAARRRIQLFRLQHLDFVPRPDDIFIVTYPRSGTTWLQMILYQLTTDGSMEIPHIAEYCPWFERSLASARGFETRPPPRIFKSHLPYQRIPKGPGRYIYVARDGRDVAISYYNLYRMYVGYEGTFAEFFDRFMRGKVQFGSWFQHVHGWWQHRHDPNVLFLTYEELTRDLEGCIRKIIAFCHFDVPPEKLPLIVERCGFAFMKRHESKFDPTLETLWEEGVHLNSFLRAGRVGDGARELTKEQQARFDRAFHAQLEQRGFAWPGPGSNP